MSLSARTGTLCGDHVRGDRLRDGRATSGDITYPHIWLSPSSLPTSQSPPSSLAMVKAVVLGASGALYRSFTEYLRQSS